MVMLHFSRLALMNAAANAAIKLTNLRIDQLKICTAIVPLRGGGISRANRRSCVISAASVGQSADGNCQFGGCLPHTRLPFRRENCTICNLWSKSCRFCSLGRSVGFEQAVDGIRDTILRIAADAYIFG
jgi:hypothetical protein